MSTEWRMPVGWIHSRHKKSGARIAILSNNDDNKVFYIGFRTPPEDETGVPRILLSIPHSAVQRSSL